jgi:adenine phosphoribosyltransferase
MGVKKVYINFIIELEDLQGRKVFPDDVNIDALIKF